MSAPTSDTIPIRTEEGFDEARVALYLQAHLPEMLGDRTITFDQFSGGRANLTYQAVAEDIEVVLRRAPLGEVAKGGHDMAREFKVLSRLWQSYPLAPRAYHYCADPDVMGKPFFVMERRRGHVVRDTWPPGWRIDDDAVKRKAAESFVDALAELHRIDAEEVGLGDLGYPVGFVERQIEGWAKRWNAARTRDLPNMDTAVVLLHELLPSPQGVAVLHNDFKLDNAMLADDGSLVAVFDWDMATRGDPLVDVGAMLAYWTGPGGATFGIFGANALTFAPYMTREEVLSRYAIGSGFDISAVRFYEGLALYRIAVIIEQLYARYASGQTSDERFASFAELVPLLAEAALDVLTGSD